MLTNINMDIVYTNKFEDKFVEQSAERFCISGTIMNASVKNVGGYICHRLWIEDSKGGYSVTIWDDAKGYDKDLLKSGQSIKVCGIMHKQYYMGNDGTPKCFKDYRGLEILK